MRPVRAHAPVLKFEYRPFLDKGNIQFPLNQPSEVTSNEVSKWVILEKTQQVASAIMSGIAFMASPLTRFLAGPIQWLKHHASIIGFWIIHPRIVSFSQIKETYAFMAPLIADYPGISKSVLLEQLVGRDAQLRRASQLFLSTLQEARKNCLKMDKQQAPLPTEEEFCGMFRCHLLASFISDHLLEEIRCKMKLPENSDLICQINSDFLDELGRVDDLTLELIKKSNLNPNDYTQMLLCLSSAERTLETPNLRARFAGIFPHIQKNLALELLSERIERLKKTQEIETTWFSRNSQELPLAAAIMSEYSLSQEEPSPITTLESRNHYSAIRDLTHRFFKETSRLIECLSYSLPCAIWNRTQTVWKLRLSRWANDFFESDRMQRQQHFFESHILSASIKVPELANLEWMNSAQKHFESWQSLSYLIESYLKTLPEYCEDDALDYEDILYVFITSNFCRYHYDQGLKKANQLLQSHLPKHQIESSWLQNTLHGQLHFCDAHTLRMMERLQKKPRALGEVLMILADKKLPHEMKIFEQHFDTRCPSQRFYSIEIIPLGVSEELPHERTFSPSKPTYLPAAYVNTSVNSTQYSRPEAPGSEFMSPTYYDQEQEGLRAF